MEQEQLRSQPAGVRGGMSAVVLKTIAVVAMVIDHVAWAFVATESPLGIAMHFVGRITGPVMFFFVVEGYHHTRNANRYTLRMGGFALIFWLPFYYFEFGRLPGPQGFTPVGVIFTLFLGLLALRARHELKNRTLSALGMVACLWASLAGDWPVFGVALVLLFDFFRGSFKKQCLAAGALFLLTSGPSLIVGIQEGSMTNLSTGIIQLGQFLPLILLRFYSGQRGGRGAFSKWFFYIVYPLHLLILGLLRYVIFPLA